MPVAMEQADKKIFFHLWYSYWLEEMVFILSNKAAAVLRAGALIAAVFSFLLVGFPVLMSLCGLAFFVFSWFCSKGVLAETELPSSDYAKGFHEY